MRGSTAKILFILTLLICTSNCQSLVTKHDRIQILEESNVFGLFVPSGDLVMIFPKNGLSQESPNAGGSTASPRYFYFSDSNSSFILSGWFEPASRFTGTKEIWNHDVSKWKANPALTPIDTKFEKFGGWDCVLYTTRMGSISRKHIRGHWVQDGTWIDVHISSVVTTSESVAEQRARDFLSTIVIKNINTK